jgi:hypothetical protein
MTITQARIFLSKKACSSSTSDNIRKFLAAGLLCLAFFCQSLIADAGIRLFFEITETKGVEIKQWKFENLSAVCSKPQSFNYSNYD